MGYTLGFAHYDGSGACDTEEDSTADDLFSVCLSELKGYLHEVHVALGAYLDPESTYRIKTHGSESRGQGGSTLRRPLDERM